MRQGDERVDGEYKKIASDAFFLNLAVLVLVSGLQLFYNSSFLGFLPAIIGGVGSLLFLIVRYAAQGILFSRKTDERIEAYKVQTKAFGVHFSLFVHVFGGGVLLFFDVEILTLFFVIASWFPLAAYMTFRTVKNGLMGFGSKKETKVGFKALAIGAVIGALFFGVLFSFFMFLTLEISDMREFMRVMLVSAVGFGVLWFFGMALTIKLCDKFAKRRLKKANSDTSCENTASECEKD